ncbi:hypothetical protein G7Y89_g1351 [Cudoniella acicularis]|uniref:Uncharacterized protein n=1 Tax=Cudoniella acicularis TaxID=354080 RepID=A0A8H4RXF4_9HELO|nr:hypothetical protein G7Y89_g1351 [Cudoniella acicularis]
MANWKEKGEVPDSDDEDDLDLDIDAPALGTPSSNNRHDELRINDGHELLHGGDEEDIIPRDLESKLDGTLAVEIPIFRNIQNTTPEAKSPNHSIQHVDDFPQSSPCTPRVFKMPLGFLDSDDDAISTHSEHESQKLVKLSDDIGTATMGQVCENQKNPPAPKTFPSLQAEILPNQQPTNVYRRSFRQRNPIQLHPYMLEQEKYRQTLKARGIAPMRLVQSQDDTQPKSGESTSLDSESQDVPFETGESQLMDVDWDPPPSPAQKSPDGNREATFPNENPYTSDAEEFPDLDELLAMPQLAPRRIEPKRRFKTYSTKSQRPQLSKIQTQSSLSKGRKENNSILNTLASPPTTSSPFTANHHGGHKSFSRVASLSSKESTPSWLGQDEPDSQVYADLPTPSISATKTASRVIHIDSDSDTDSTDHDPGSPANSSSDESLQIRKVSKKIRGVLPASHLRLDQPKQWSKAPSRTQRDSVEASPPRPKIRRGVALPKVSAIGTSPSVTAYTQMPFLSDESDEGDNEVFQRGLIAEEEGSNELDGIFDQRQGFAEEDGSVDAMLPARKRKSKDSGVQSRKKSRIGFTSQKGGKIGGRQLRITEHLGRSQHSNDTRSKAPRKNRIGPRGVHRQAVSNVKGSAPRLSILDVTSPKGKNHEKLPRFIRIAARTARFKNGQGKQSPSKKFIKLASREDTFDAQSVLQDWRQGNIQPKSTENLRKASNISRPPFRQISGNVQTRLPSPLPMTRPHQSSEAKFSGMPRRLVVSKPQQRSMNDFVTTQNALSEHRYSSGEVVRPSKDQARIENRGQKLAPARPAQLEASELEHSHWNAASAFKSTKKTLDAIYRSARRRTEPRLNLQLGRFLSDEDAIRPSIELISAAGAPKDNPTNPVHKLVAHRTQRKNNLPLRVDVGAAKYRQPSEPLILESLSSSHLQNATNEENKLEGLGKFGTKYPIQFDVYPLHPGVYFHESTFIGSGRLSEALKGVEIQRDTSHPPITLKLNNKELQWGNWTEDVSSEIGQCFDWIIDQFLLSDSATPHSLSTDSTAAMSFIIEYVQHRLSFPESHSEETFLARMTEVLKDFLARLKVPDQDVQPKRAQLVQVLSFALVLLLQLLHLSRSRNDNRSYTLQLEDLLVAVARSCTRLLICEGLEDIRKLYDNLHYLSFRENGIKKDEFVVQSWVIIIHVLGAAKIAKGSFWDVVNLRLIGVEIKLINDARILEKLWYSMFTLLPLFEFDEFGILRIGRRHKNSFDNWWLPQQILKRIFELYRLNPRQHPGYNEYCKATLGRCHFLMTEWGWWNCSSIIGTIFDFFASQKLAHLRNEEVYASPSFLRELDTEPTLLIQPEDRCFHIFLKLVALAIKHMKHNMDTKSIRNLVARLLPNHDRQYLKEEDIHHRELASLRNHHDILCTLFWSAPVEQRPSLTLIQNLVIPDRSHNEACLINVRAWENLTRFVVTTSTAPSDYQLFTAWQNLFCSALSRQFLETESEVRCQAEALAKTKLEIVSETRVQEIIISNKASTMEMLRSMVKVMDHTVAAAASSSMAIQALNADMLHTICSLESGSKTTLSEELLKDSIDVISRYIDQIDLLQPTFPETSSSEDVDSQGSLDMNLNLDRVEMIYRLQSKVLPLLRGVLLNGLQPKLATLVSPALLSKIVLCWARLVCKVTESAMNLKDFLVAGQNAVFQRRQGSSRIQTCWLLFLKELVEHKALDDFKIPGFDIGSEWLVALTMPQSEAPQTVDMVNNFTTILQLKGYYLSIWPSIPSRGQEIDSSLLTSGAIANHTLLRVAIDIIRSILSSQANVNFVLGNLSLKDAQSYFSAMLQGVMESIRSFLENTNPGSDEHKAYVEFVQPIVSIIRSYAHDIQTLLPFFVRPSTYYWPEDNDPTLYAAGIISCSLRLAKSPGGASSELFHYLYSGWKKDLVRGRIEQHMNYVKKGMGRWEFTTFLLSQFMPAALHVGFHSPGGWALCATYLPLLSSRTVKALRKRDIKAKSTFACLINLLKIILNDVATRYSDSGNSSAEINLIHRRYITHVTCQFLLSIVLPLRQYAKPYPGEIAIVEEVVQPLLDYLSRLRSSSSNAYSEWPRFEVDNGEHVENFTSVLIQDQSDHWEVDNSRCVAIIMEIRGRERTTTEAKLGQLLGSQTLREMLGVASPYLERMTDDPAQRLRDTPLGRNASPLMQDVYF